MAVYGGGTWKQYIIKHGGRIGTMSLTYFFKQFSIAT
jgi:hypothetical protein